MVIQKKVNFLKLKTIRMIKQQLTQKQKYRYSNDQKYSEKSVPEN